MRDKVLIERFSAIDALGSKTSGLGLDAVLEWKELFWCRPNGWSIAKCVFFLTHFSHDTS